MTDLRQVFSAPFNWCDWRCERCPLASECPVQRREQQRRWVHEARGRDPDDPDVWGEDMREDLESTLRMVREIAQAEGIDLNEPLPPRPSVLAAKRLEKVSVALVLCVVESSRRDDAQTSAAVAELRSVANTLVMKAARIACHLDSIEDDEAWARDAAPNLLLIDRLKARFVETLSAIKQTFDADERVTRALAELARNLDPLVLQVGPEARRVLAALEARGAAPSPFIREAASAARVNPG